MKYVYRAMANPAGQNCTKLLQWHDKLYEKVITHTTKDDAEQRTALDWPGSLTPLCARCRSLFVLQDGPGIIMRTLVDRKINGNPEPATK